MLFFVIPKNTVCFPYFQAKSCLKVKEISDFFEKNVKFTVFFQKLL